MKTLVAVTVNKQGLNIETRRIHPNSVGEANENPWSFFPTNGLLHGNGSTRFFIADGEVAIVKPKFHIFLVAGETKLFLTNVTTFTPLRQYAEKFCEQKAEEIVEAWEKNCKIFLHLEEA